MTGQNRFRQISIILFVLSLITLAVHIESLVKFNRHEFQIHGNSSAGEVQMKIDVRENSTSTWLKRAFPLSATQLVDLTGQTIDGVFHNGSGDEIQDWSLRINIAGDCFINQAWNGEVEIHQYAGTDREKVQRLNLQSYELADVLFEKRYDGDLLIPLQAGDYVIYYPSTRFSEMPITGGEDVTIGMIFYYLDQLDLSDYDVLYHHHRGFTQGITFYPFIVLSVLWLLSVVLDLAVNISYRRARKEMELRKSGIFCMSDIYAVIYMIRLQTGEMTPVTVNEAIERERAKHPNAKELLSAMLREDCEEKYLEMMLEFIDTDTLAERLKDRNSIVSEFISRQHGWCSVRFYAMDRTEGKPIEDVILAIQNINEEKKELEAITARIDQAESASKSKSVLMEHVADALEPPLQDLMTQINRILQENGNAAIQECARNAHSTVTQMLTLTEGLADSSALGQRGVQVVSEAYSLKKLLIAILRDVCPLAEMNHTEIRTDIAETLPDGLRGNPRLLREILINLFSAMLPVAAGGSIQLSLYGKAQEDRIHLLFSLRAFSDPAKIPARNPADPAEQEEPAGLAGLNLDIVSALLNGIGSELRPVLTPAGRAEYYFETEQPILDHTAVGKISMDEMNAGERI